LAATNFIDDFLDRLRGGVGRHLRERITQIKQRLALDLVRLSKRLGWLDEVAEIVNGITDQRVEPGMRLWRDIGQVEVNKAPEQFGVLRVGGRHKSQQHRKRDRNLWRGRIARMHMPNRV